MIQKLTQTMYDAMPRRQFIERGISYSAVLSGLLFLTRRALASGVPGQAYSIITCPNPCSASNNCGNAGYKPTSMFITTGAKCCKCKLTGAGCPPGTAPGGQWRACCVCSEHAGTKKGRVYIYQDCCASPDPGTTDCPKADCFDTATPVLWNPNGAGTNCSTLAAKSWCTGAVGGPQFGTLNGTASGECCQWI